MFLQPDLLPVLEHTFFAYKVEVNLVHASAAFTFIWGCEFELLLNAFSVSVALLALEHANGKFRLHFSCPGHCAFNAHDSAQVSGFQVAHFVDVGKVVNSDLEESVAFDLMAQPNQESFQGLTQVRLKSVVLLQDVVNHIRLVKLKLCQMGEVNLHCGFLALLNLLGLIDIEPNWLPRVFLSFGIVQIVGIVLTQLKAM